MAGKATLADLFKTTFSAKVEGLTLYFRALSDVDQQSRDEYALRARALKRKSLLDPESNDHLLYLEWLDGASDEDLKLALVARKRSELVTQAFQDLKEELLPLPDDATDAEKTDLLDQRDQEEQRVANARAAYVTDRLKPYEESLQPLDHAALLQKTKAVALEIHTSAEQSRAWNRYTLFAVTYTDPACEVPYFASPEAVGALTPPQQNSLLQLYFNELGKFQELDLQRFFSTAASKESPTPSNGSGGAGAARKSHGGSRGGGLASASTPGTSAA